MIKLSEHFTLEEFTFSQTAIRLGIDNRPNHVQIEKLKTTAGNMEQVREVLGGKPIIIKSGFRSYALNKAVGGSMDSQHQKAEAVDFVCPEFGNPKVVCQALEISDINFDQLIYEGTWVHISFSSKPRRDILTASFAGGKVNYFEGIV